MTNTEVITDQGPSDQSETTMRAEDVPPPPPEEKKPLPPLALMDARFGMLVNSLKREMSNKFLKFYAKTKDVKSREQAMEMMSLLVSFSLSQLRDIQQAFSIPKDDAVRVFKEMVDTWRPLYRMLDIPHPKDVQTSEPAMTEQPQQIQQNSAPTAP